MHKVVIIGSGQVGQTLGRLLNNSGKYQVVGVCDRKLKNAQAGARFIGTGARVYKNKTTAVEQADIIFITTPDSVIEQVCQEIFSGAQSFADKIVIHCSGNQPSDILKSARRHNHVYIASIHPLQTFADKKATVRNFKGTYCAYEGQPEALAGVRNIIKALGGKPVAIKAKDKTLYHIGCVFASNYLVTLVKTSLELLESCGFKEKDILAAIRPMVNATVGNILSSGPASALTGPIARGDLSTIKNHLKALGKLPPIYRTLYCELGRQTVSLARQKGTVSSGQASLLRRAMNI